MAEQASAWGRMAISLQPKDNLMAKSSIFSGAVPYSEALSRLNSVFRPKVGDLITHEQLAPVIQAEVGSNRYNGVIHAWMRYLYREHGLDLCGEGRARGIGLMVCTPSESSERRIGKARRLHKHTGRLAIQMGAVDTSGFNTQEATRHNLSRRYLHEMHAFGSARLKEIPVPPKPVATTNVRLLKG